MGVKKEVEALNLARKIAMFNSESIYYVKNKLWLISASEERKHGDRYEKFSILVRDFSPHTDPSLVLANYKNNDNHDITKLDVETIKEVLLDGIKNE